MPVTDITPQTLRDSDLEYTASDDSRLIIEVGDPITMSDND
jgi:hypothetical protein